MDLLERITTCPFDGAPCHGPRSQGGHDEHYQAELQALESIPSLAGAWAGPRADDDAPPAPELLKAVFLAAHPERGAFADAAVAAAFATWLSDLREMYRSVRSPGKRPWPVFTDAAEGRALTAADCDAIFATAGVHVIGAGAAVGEYLAGRPLDTPVLKCDGATAPLVDALPPLAPVPPAVKGAALRKLCNDTACARRVLGSLGCTAR